MNNAQIWEEYSLGKQTYSQLAKKYNCSTKTIQSHIDKFKIEKTKIEAREVIILLDTT